jgi:hypothetical protein
MGRSHVGVASGIERQVLMKLTAYKVLNGFSVNV